jgi:hypothetical protein
MRSGRALRVLPLLPWIAGCYTYAATEPGGLRVSEQVRVHLTREGTLGLPDLAGHEGPVLDGAVVDASEGTLALRVPVAVRREGFLQGALAQNVVLPMDQIERIEMRRLSPSRTGMILLGTAGAAAFVVLGIVESSIFREPPGPSGGDDLRAPPP